MSSENGALDDKALLDAFKVDLQFLSKNVPKSPSKLPRINATHGSGNWQVRERQCDIIIYKPYVNRNVCKYSQLGEKL